MKAFARLYPILFVLFFVFCRHYEDTAQVPDAYAIYEQALSAFDNDSVTDGEQLLHEAISRANEDGDLHTLYLAQLRLAESLSWGNSQAALDTAKAALQTYERQPDSERNHIIILDYIGTYASQLAYNTDGSYDEALDFVQRAHALAQNSIDTLGTDLLCQTLTSLANIYWAKEAFDEALCYARKAEACTTDELRLGTLQVLARCLVSCDSLDAAEHVYRQMQPGDDLQAAYIVQSNLAKLALRRNDTKEAEATIDEAFQYAEDLYYKALQQKDNYYHAVLLQERENERLRYTSALHRWLLWGGMCVFVLIVGAVWVIAHQRLRSITIQRQQEERLHAQKLAAQSEHLRQRDATIAFLQGFILERSSVIQKLGKSAERHIVLTPHEWEEIECTLNAIDGDRFAHLRESHPDLKEEDLQLCILTRLRLTNRAIGNMYGISISAVQHRKLKLKKEVFGEDDPETTLEQVIDRIYNY